jgi:lipopolysaccharide transport system permease protein
LLLAFVSSIGVSLWLSAMNVQFRDVRYMIPFLTQAWFFLTPITYSSSIVPDAWQLIYGLNPMVGVVEGFRWALLGTDTAPGPMILVSSLIALLLFFGGMYYFRRMEKNFADIV